MGSPIRNEVRIADLKAHLSEYLRIVRKGREVIIKDRETPVAKLAPLGERKRPFRIVPASKPIGGIDQFQGIALSGVKPSAVNRALAETREDR